jgi:hypothetical protein
MLGTSQTDLERQSARPYLARVSDPEDFAHVWERTIVPAVIKILQANCDCDFSIDVYNFPELSSGSVPRVICITLPIVASDELQELVRDELARTMPSRFHQTKLKFCRWVYEDRGRAVQSQLPAHLRSPEEI